MPSDIGENQHGIIEDKRNNLALASEFILSNEDRTPMESGEKERKGRRGSFEMLNDDEEEGSSTLAAGVELNSLTGESYIFSYCSIVFKRGDLNMLRH